MPCSKTWNKSTGDVWRIRAVDNDTSSFMTGHLSVLNWDSQTVRHRVFTEDELDGGIDLSISSGNTYLMAITVAPKSNTVRITGSFAVDGVPLNDVVCEVTADDPLCLWRMRRL